MKHLSQNNPEWSGIKMGVSDLTIGRWGCTTTCISMLSDYFVCYQSPPEIAENVDNYTTDGLIIWSHLSFDRMKFNRREHGRNDAAIQSALSDPNSAVILEVNNGAHWVVATGKAWGNDYYIIDPWDGTKTKAIQKYNNITGAAYFEEKESDYPDDIIEPDFGIALAERDYPFYLAVEQHGELWFMHPVTGEREYLHPDNIIAFMEKYATGISDADLARIPIKKD